MKNLNYVIREAAEQDLEQIMELENSCFGNDAWDSDTMHFEVVAHHTHYLAAFEGSLGGGVVDVFAG